VRRTCVPVLLRMKKVRANGPRYSVALAALIPLLAGCGGQLGLSKLMAIAKDVPVPGQVHFVRSQEGVSYDATTGSSTNEVQLYFDTSLSCNQAKAAWAAALEKAHRHYSISYPTQLGALYINILRTPAHFAGVIIQLDNCGTNEVLRVTAGP
jgi:hypothetical protein